MNDPSRHQKVLAGDDVGTRRDGIHHTGAVGGPEMLSAGGAWAHHNCLLGTTGIQQQVLMLLDPSSGSVCGPGLGRVYGLSGHVCPGWRRPGNVAPTHPRPVVNLPLC